MKILVTAGATREPIDGVRFLTNFATGKTASVLADHFAEQGTQVVYLHAVGAIMPSRPVKSVQFSTFADLDAKLHTHLQAGECDAVVHLAAVGDYALEHIELSDGSIASTGAIAGKLDSSQSIKLQMRRNHKILPLLKSYAGGGKQPFVVGFKLTRCATSEQICQKVAKIWQAGGVDLVVHNAKEQITASCHPATFYASDGKVLARTASKGELAEKLYKIIEGELKR